MFAAAELAKEVRRSNIEYITPIMAPKDVPEYKLPPRPENENQEKDERKKQRLREGPHTRKSDWSTEGWRPLPLSLKRRI